MSLIVKRLRLLQKEWGRIVSRETRGGPSQKAIAPTCRDAADEIERLMKQRDERADRYHLALWLLREERERSERLRAEADILRVMLRQTLNAEIERLR